jgi:plastocyanin
MMGTWMTANVFMRIIPRQLKMVEASKAGIPVNQDWGKNAKNRSTHNTYLTLPVIFVMLSNHFPQTYGHEYNWLILLVISAGGAAIREYFVVRLKNPKRSIIAAIIGIALIVGVIIFSREPVINDEPLTPVETHLEAPAQASPTEVAPEVTPAVAATGKSVTISGSVIFEGAPPKGKKLNLPAACAKNFKGEAYSNEVIVNNGKVQNVLVRVISGLEGKTFTDIPPEEVQLDQRGCIYTPRVVGARVGQKVTFINSDPVFHNVRALTQVNQKFNMAMPHKDQRETKVFNKPEVFLQAKCSVHPWMGAYIAVMDNPYFSVSSATGDFTIKDLPTGKYTLEAWHEVFGTQKQEITVTEEGMTPLKFIFK